MDIVLIVLGVGVVALGGLAVWLGLRLGRANGELASLRAGEASQRQAADTQIAELRNELAQAKALADSSGQRVAQQAEELARLNERRCSSRDMVLNLGSEPVSILKKPGLH